MRPEAAIRGGTPSTSDAMGGRWRTGAVTSMRLRACDRVGRDVMLRGVPRIINAGFISIGDDARVDSLPIVSHLATGPRGRLEIGAGVSIGAGAAIAAHVSIRILDGATLGPGVMVLDTDFHAPGEQGARGRSDPIVIGRDVQLGARVTVLRGAHIGDAAVVVAGSVVSGVIAAGATVSGVPARDAAGASTAMARGAVPDRVRAIVRDVLRLDDLPAADCRTRDIVAWDSLGALNVLLSLERAFELTLRPDDVLEVQTVGGLQALVERAMDARGGRFREV